MQRPAGQACLGVSRVPAGCLGRGALGTPHGAGGRSGRAAYRWSAAPGSRLALASGAPGHSAPLMPALLIVQEE